MLCNHIQLVANWEWQFANLFSSGGRQAKSMDCVQIKEFRWIVYTLLAFAMFHFRFLRSEVVWEKLAEKINFSFGICQRQPSTQCSFYAFSAREFLFKLRERLYCYANQEGGRPGRIHSNAPWHLQHTTVDILNICFDETSQDITSFSFTKSFTNFFLG